MGGYLKNSSIVLVQLPPLIIAWYAAEALSDGLISNILKM
jgi:hypothetical protein